ncbi:bifunctional riboflavin kinase/FAD synthetase [Flavobacterium caeni]|uniref:bifunctional riboflavin kinase/FAD synthetase n=1 Tax=Flavobacterium caeni TaxID=490189 RepID=UPI000B81BE6F|nr:bifunctional riboflavin kinase/FAD synthetase [Flavobacterium caeni]
MKIHRSIYDFKPEKKTVVTLGTFDGVHIGHRKIIEKLLQSAAQNQAESVILTFFPHPRMVLQDRSEIQLLNTLDEKIALLENTGLDHLIIHPFDENFSRLTADEFVSKILVGQFNIGKIIIGHDHRFGRNRTANIDDLIVFGQEYGFEVEQISAQEIDAVSVSSTKIRNALHQGNIALANEYLGYPYPLNGTVVQGKQLGRTIGFPTANLHIAEDYKLIPKIGVYVVQSQLEGRTVFGMMSIGTNPTVAGEHLTIETYFFDFDADLYGQKITLSLLEYLREEQKFESIDALKTAIANDQQKALGFLSKK